MAIPVKGRALTAAFNDDDQSVTVTSNGSELTFRSAGEADYSDALSVSEKSWVHSLFAEGFNGGTCRL